MNKTQLVEAVLHLPRQERAEVATAVLRSLDDDLPEPVGPEEWEQAWSDEIRQRIDQLDRGEVSTIPAHQVFADLRARLAEKRRSG